MSRFTSGSGQREKGAQGAASDFYTLLPQRLSGNWHPVLDAERPTDVRRCYHSIWGLSNSAGPLLESDEVRPQTIGRVLGIGIRVAGRVAGQAMSGDPSSAAAQQPNPPSDVTARGRTAGQTTRNVGRGISGLLKPFRTVAGKLWLEVIGAFFFLPVLVFAPVLWRTRASWQQGPDHRTFVSAAVIIVVFLYLGVTSFWRARKD